MQGPVALSKDLMTIVNPLSAITYIEAAAQVRQVATLRQETEDKDCGTIFPGTLFFILFWFFPANAEVWYLQRDMLQNLDHKWFDAQIHRFLVYATIKQSFFRRSVCRFQQPFCLIIPNIQPSAAQHSGRKPCTPMAPLGIKNCPQIATIPAARPAQVAWAWSWKPPCMKDFPLPRLIIKGYITIYSNLLVSKWVKSPQLELG